MKIRYYFSIAMAALVMTNCSQEDELQEIQENSVHTITATIEGGSRSAVTDGGTFSWTTGDAITVWNGSNQTYTYSGNGNKFSGSSADISGYAVYPEGNHSNLSGSSLPTVNLKKSYSYGSTNAIMLAKVENNKSLSFSHLGGLMRFVVKNIPSNATSFTFTANSGITGDFNVTTEAGENVIKAAIASNSNKTVTINFTGSETERTFYVPLPVGTYNGFTITVGSSTYTSQAINTINRRTLLLMPTFTCNGTKLVKGDNSVTLENTEQDINISGNEDLVIDTPNSSDANAQLNLNYTPTTNATLNISDGQTGYSQDSKAKVVINVENNTEIKELNINAPTLTVELTSGTYETITAKTATQTLIIKKGVTVKSLKVIGGKVEIENGANVNSQTQLRVLTFEDEDAKFSAYTLGYFDNKEISNWSDLIAEDQYGDYILGYGSWMGECIPTEDSHYSWYDENNTYLAHNFPLNYDSYCFAGGGHAISNYASNDYSSHGDYTYQLTIYDKDANGLVRQGGGHNGSDNFAMHYGYYDGSEWNQTTEDDLPAIYFKDDKARVIDHLWVCLSTYEYYCLYEGNGLTAPLGEGDYVIIEAIGHKEDGTKSKISIRVADLQNGIIDDWTKWDLSSLGKVKKVHFNIIGTNDNGYGFSQPAYFAYDDVAVQFTE